jgi:serine/threonine-protein kinase
MATHPSTTIASHTPFMGLTTVTNTTVTLEEVIGYGRDAIVYRGACDGKRVAVKVFDSSTMAREGRRHRIAKEILVAQRMRSEHLVTTFDVGMADNRPFIVMEHLAGGDLQQFIDAYAPIEPRRACGLALQIADGLAAIHKAGFVHGDLKPRNVLRTESGTLKIGDFGVTQRLRERQARIAAVGTIDFVAPEVVRGETPGPQADIYAFGVLVFALLTGQLPFQGSSPLAVALAHAHTAPPRLSEVQQNMSPDLDSFVQRCLAKGPADRFADGRVLYRALTRLVRKQSGCEKHILQPSRLCAVMSAIIRMT